MASTEAQVAHVWRRLGFGPTRADLDAGVVSGPQAVVADLLGRPFASASGGTDPWGFPTGTDYVAADQYAARMLELMAFGPSATGSGTTSPSYNPLQERLAWILHGLVVIAIIDSVYFADMKDHVTLLRSSAGGSYKQLLLDVSTRPGMLKYLSGYQNTKGHPNENYARELMELFSLGRLNPRDGSTNYDQNDVREIARALTGWQYNWTTGGTSFDVNQWDSGTKTFRGVSIGAAKLPEVINAITGHPAWQFFVPARLYRELTGLTATSTVLDALAPVWGSTGNVLAVVQAIVNRPEFLSDQAIFARVKSPVELVASAARLLGYTDLVTGSGNLGYAMTLMNQHPFRAPNVSGWYKGDQWLNADGLLRWQSWANVMAMKGFNWAGSVVGAINPAVNVVYQSATGATAADFVLKFAGLSNASPKTRAELNDYATTGTWTQGRAAGLLNLLLVAPEFLAN